MALQLRDTKFHLKIATDQAAHKSAVIRSMKSHHDVLLPSLERRAREREQVCMPACLLAFSAVSCSAVEVSDLRCSYMLVHSTTFRKSTKATGYQR